MCTQESVLQSQLRDALHQLSAAHSQTSKDAALVMRLQRQVEDQRQQVQELTNQSSEQQGVLQQLRDLADKREAELLQCQVTSEQLREEERRRAVVELELEGAREQLRVAQGRLADEQAHLQGVQLEVCAWAGPCDCTSLITVPPFLFHCRWRDSRRSWNLCEGRQPSSGVPRAKWSGNCQSSSCLSRRRLKGHGQSSPLHRCRWGQAAQHTICEIH